MPVGLRSNTSRLPWLTQRLPKEQPRRSHLPDFISPNTLTSSPLGKDWAAMLRSLFTDNPTFLPLQDSINVQHAEYRHPRN
ncbi:MAG: hypothetical protein IPJ88_13155 [Myxococcales bacterium]|nr:MAG: hypothetical protein IPJ88_13155 [Myxococcales bacterium]